MKEKIPDSLTIARAAWAHLRKTHPDRSVDELLTYPEDAIELCREVRRKLGKIQTSNHEVLKALINARKRSQLK